MCVIERGLSDFYTMTLLMMKVDFPKLTLKTQAF